MAGISGESMDSLITSVLDCISRVREMQPTLANSENKPSSFTLETSNSNDRRPATSIGSEVSNLFPTFSSVSG